MKSSGRARAFALHATVFAAALLLQGCVYLLPASALALLGGKGGGGGVIVLTAEDADLLVSRGPKDGGASTEGRNATVVAAQLRLTATRATTLRTLTVTASGTGNDAAIPTVRLVRDADGDGLVGPADPQLGTTTTFGGDDGVATFDGLNLDLQAGAALDALVVITTPAEAKESDTFTVGVASAQALNATTLVNGEQRQVRVFGVPIAAAPRTISATGSLRLVLGPNSPPNAAVFPNAQDAALLQVELRVSSAEAVRVSELRLRTSGGGDERVDVARAELWLDVDSNGRLDLAVDRPIVLSAKVATDDGALVFQGVAQTLAASSVARWLVVYDLAGTARDGATFRVDLEAGDTVVTQGTTSGATIVPTGAPLSGGATLTVSRAALSVEPGPFNPTRTSVPGATNVPVYQARLTAGTAEPVVISSFGVRGAGAGDEAADVAGVSLWVDANGNGALDAGEPRLAGPGAYAANDGALTLGGFTRELAAGASESWLVTYDVAPGAVGGDAFDVRPAGPTTVAVSGKLSALGVTPTVSSTAGGLLTVVGSLALAAGPAPPPAQTPLASSIDVPAAQLRLSAGAGEAVRLTAVVVQPSGTGHDQLGVTAVDLVRDADADGTVSAGDVVLRTGAFPGDDAPLTFSDAAGLVPGDLAAGASVTLLLRYRLSGQAVEGQTFVARADNASLGAVGVLSGLPIAAGGVPVTGASITARRARLTFTLGPQDPGASDVLNGATAVPALQLEALAGPGEDVQLGSITFRTSGTASDPAVVGQARLYREGAGAGGVVDATDVQLGAGQVYSGDDGFVTFSPAGPAATLTAGTSARLLLVHDIASTAPAPGTLTARLAAAADVVTTGASSGLAGQVVGAPQVGGQKTVRRGSLTVDAGLQNPPAAPTFPGAQDVELLQVRLTAGFAEPVEVQSVRLFTAGGADESTAVTRLELFLDVNNDGLVSLGTDVLLATAAAPLPDDGPVVLAIGAGAVVVPAGGQRSLLASYDVQPAAAPGGTLRARVAAPAADVTARGTSSNQPIVPAGAAVEGNNLTLVRGSLTLSVAGTNPGAGVVLPNAAGIPMLQVRLQTGGTESVAVTQVRVTHAGTGDPTAGITATHLYRDVNGNGLLDADTLLGTTTFTGGVATFALGAGVLDVAESATAFLLVVHQFSGAAANGQTFQARVAVDADVSATGNSSNVAIPPSGAPLAGGAKTIQTASLAISDGAQDPGASSLLRNQAAAVVEQVTLAAGSAEAVRVSQVTLTASGTLPAQTDISRVRLYRENDPPNGVLDGDALVGDLAGGFGAGGTVTFTIAAGDLDLPAGGQKSLLAVVDLAAPAGSAGRTLQVRVAANADVVARGVASNLPVTPTGAPVAGSTHTVVEAALTLAAGAQMPPAGDVTRTQANVEVHQLQLSAGPAEAVRVQSLRFTRNGTGDHATGLVGVRLYREKLPADGVLGGDALISSATFTAGGQATLAIAAGGLDVSAGAAAHTLLVFDLGGTAANNQTFRADLLAAADVTATGLTSGLAVPAGGLPVAGPTKTVREVTVAVAAGVALPDTTRLTDATAVPALHLDLATGPLDGARIQQVVVRASGSAIDSGVVARLYRDADGDGTLDAGEPQLASATFTADDGAVTLGIAPGQLDIPVSQSRRLLVQLDLPGTAVNGQTHRLRLAAAADVTGQGLATGAPVTATGTFPIQGPLTTIQSTTLTFGVTTQTGAANVFPNAKDVPLLRFTLAAGAVDGARVTSIGVRPTAASTGNDALVTARLYHDVNANGLVDAGTDALLDARAGDDALLVFTAAPALLDVPASQTRHLLVAYDLSGPPPSAGQALQLTVDAADAAARGLSSGAPINPPDRSGGPFQGGLQTIHQGTLALATGPQNPVAADVFGNQTRVVQQVQLTATNEPVRVTRWVVNHAGSGAPAAAVTQARLYRDDNSNGLLDGDTFLAATTFSGATATFNGAPGLFSVPTTGPTRLLVVYVFNTAAADGHGFQAAAVAPADLLADGVTSQAAVVPTGAAAAGGAQTFRVGALALAEGPAPPPAATVYLDQLGVAVKQLELQATGEPVRLTGLTVRRAGSGVDADVARVRLLHDVNANGVLDADTSLAPVASFVAGSVTFAPAGGLITVTPGTPVRLLVAFDLAASGAHGSTHGTAAVAAPGDLTAAGASSSLAVAASGGAGASTLKTLAVGALTLAEGPAPPAAGTVFRDQTGVAVKQLELQAAGEQVRLDRLVVRRAGSGLDADVAGVRLLHDVNGNGVVDGDLTLAPVTSFVGGSATFAPAGGLVTATPGTPVRLLVVFDLAASGAAGSTQGTAAVVVPADLSATGAASGRAVTPGGAAGAGNLKTVVVGALALAEGPAPPPAGAVHRNQALVPVKQLELQATGEQVRLDALVIRRAGSGLDADVAGVRLYHDANANGLVDADTSLAPVASFVGGAVTLAPAGGLITASPGTPVRLLVVFDLASTGADLSTQRTAPVAAADLTARGVSSGQVVAAGGSAAAGNDRTVRVGALTIGAGAGNPGAANVDGAQTNVVVQQLSLTATAVAIRVASLTVGRAGAGTDAGVAQVRVHRDDNANGLLDGDTLLASGTFSGGTVTLGAGSLLTVSPGSPALLLVVYDLAATPGQTYGADAVAPADVAAFEAPSGLAVTPGGAAAAGGLQTVVPLPVVTVTQVALGPTPVFAGQDGAVALQLVLTESGGLTGARLRSLALRDLGTGHDRDGVRFVRLHADAAPFGGAVGVEDPLIGLSKYFADGGPCVIAGLDEPVPAGGTLRLHVTYDLAATVTTGQTFQARVEAAASVELQSQVGARPVTAGGTFPLDGRVMTAQGSQLTVRRAPLSPTGVHAVRCGDASVPVLALELAANGAQAVTVSALEVQSAAGGGNDATGVAAAVLYRDLAGNGVLDADDVQVARVTNPFALSGDGGAAQLTGLSEVIPVNSTAYLLVAYDLAATCAANDAFTASLVDATKVTVAAPTTTVGVGLPAAGRTLRVVGGVTAALGPQNPLGATLLVPGADQVVLQVRLTADAAEAMTVTSITFTGGGSAADHLAFTGVVLRRDDGDGVFELSDATLDAPRTFSVNDGTVSYGLAEPLAAGAQLHLWLSVNVAGAPPGTLGASFRASFALDAHLLATAAVTTSTRVSGAALTGNQFLTGTPTALFVDGGSHQLTAPDTSVQELLAADFDRDGRLDYVALRGDGALEVMKGDGLGGFTSHDTATVTAPLRGAVGDLNRDGYPDVVVMHGGPPADRVSVFLNDRAGRFGAPSDTEVVAGGDLADLAVGDYDRNGALDVVLLDRAGLALVGRRGDGAGSIDLTNSLALPAAPQRLALADVDLDGDLDAVLTDAAANVLLVPGNGAFFAGTQTDPGGTTPRDVVALDLDRDGFPDAVVIDEGPGEYRSYRSAGAATGLTFASNGDTTPGVLTRTNPRDAVVGDWDGDGRPDLAIAHAGVDGVVVRGGDGTLALPTARATEYAVPAVTDPDRLAAGDFDGDGDVDLLVATSGAADRDVQLLRGDGSTNGGQPSVAAPSLVTWSRAPRGVAVADLNRDGQLDLVVTSNGDKRTAVFLNAGGGSGFTPQAELVNDDKPEPVEVADLNRDGKLDLVVAVTGGGDDRLEFFPGNGDGSFGPVAFTACISDGDPKALAIGDLNHDGLPDAVAVEFKVDRVQVFRGNGGGFAAAQAGDRYVTSDKPIDLAVGDFDRDGELDVAVLCQTSPGRVELFRGGAGFGLAAPVTTVLDGASLGTPAALAAGDLDRDGRLDLVVVSSSGAFLQLLAGLGTGAFTPQAVTASVVAADVALADLDKDGRLDVVGARADGTGGVFVHRGLAGFGLGAATLRGSTADSSPRLALGDLNRDGDLDAAVPLEDLKRIGVFLGE